MKYTYFMLAIEETKCLFTNVHIHINLVWLIKFNATFNNITVISWCPVLLVDET